MPKLLRLVHPNAGVRAAYSRRLLRLIDEMQRSTLWWLRAAYRRDKARIVADSALTLRSPSPRTRRPRAGY